MMRECCETTAQNTGHIVFAAGPAIYKGKQSYRIRVVHSTKHGKLDENGEVTTGVQVRYQTRTENMSARANLPSLSAGILSSVYAQGRWDLDPSHDCGKQPFVEAKETGSRH